MYPLATPSSGVMETYIAGGSRLGKRWHTSAGEWCRHAARSGSRSSVSRTPSSASMVTCQKGANEHRWRRHTVSIASGRKTYETTRRLRYRRCSAVGMRAPRRGTVITRQHRGGLQRSRPDRFATGRRTGSTTGLTRIEYSEAWTWPGCSRRRSLSSRSSRVLTRSSQQHTGACRRSLRRSPSAIFTSFTTKSSCASRPPKSCGGRPA
mmetsp:Transcript_23817/g.64236  ORF Transcript_23817/g.64236 Transcript_23817/m.64236 type:complete len:208 (+) Transcript_23817:986-1609(+)